MKTLLLAVGLILAVGTLEARATPYWVAWEGNDFPENEGWERRINGVGPAIRTLHDGIMTMDGLADLQIDDYYRMERPLNAGAGEEFLMQWRLRVNQVTGHPLGLYDPGVQLFSDDDWGLALSIGIDFMRNHFEGFDIPFDAGLFHTFEVYSTDMRTYQLRLDGAVVAIGHFWEPTFTRSRIQWGDMTRGAASNVDWDYFRFGVVPEPGTGLLLLLAALARQRRTQ